ncbi:hypothetical protein T4B_80 [Trichinella pseudospiralis]|uniref:Uncharacterized protein n=1 Tax=Trichinella pseudospiralis TaxID=6337 RepID=A0A0V1KCJ3_TRIPS|nr:hypothetical protein T4A_13498 [Trichinella pseudospiralis]KRZ22153.1 hypothetical protein T4B_80 [Trichinella pseudospiralis]KRZ44971.1 hypothetical protein T4C_10220 [Trichinella pseudospiralis]
MLGSQTSWIAWKHRRQTNITQAQIEHGDTFQSDTTARMRWTSVPERVDVSFNFLQIYIVMLGSFNQQIRVVYSLRAGEDLLAAHVHIIRIGILVFPRIRHGVEWSNAERKFVQYVKVRLIFLLHQFT